MNNRKETKVLNRSGFMKVFGMGLIASVFNKKSLTGMVDDDNNSVKNDSEKNTNSFIIEPKPNVLSVSRQKNH